MTLSPYGKGWRVQVYKNGIRKSATFASKTEARGWGKRTEVDLTDKTPASVKKLSEAIARYVAEVSAQKSGHKWEALRLAAMLVHFGNVTAVRHYPAHSRPSCKWSCRQS